MTTGPTMLSHSDAPLVARHDGLLLDLDGVIYRGAEAVPHAIEAVLAARSAGLGVGYVTNNASREPQTVADQITALGLPTQPGDVVTSAQAAARLLIGELPAGAAVMAIGGQGLHTALTEAGFTLVGSVDDSPVAVVQGFGPDVSWRDLAQATWAVAAGARHVATNLDRSIPLERGPVPGNGTLVAAVRAVTGITPEVAGKPEPTIFRYAAERIEAQAPLVVGDRLDTDLRGARAAGQTGLFVLSGVHQARDAVLADPAQRPSYLAVDLRGLHQAHPAPIGEAGGWRLGAHLARVVAGRLELDGSPLPTSTAVEITLDAWRTLCAAAWSSADAGQAVDVHTVPHLRVRYGESR